MIKITVGLVKQCKIFTPKTPTGSADSVFCLVLWSLGGSAVEPHWSYHLNEFPAACWLLSLVPDRASVSLHTTAQCGAPGKHCNQVWVTSGHCKNNRVKRKGRRKTNTSVAFILYIDRSAEPQVHLEIQGTQIRWKNLQKGKHCKARVREKVWGWQKDRQLNKMENTDFDLCTYSSLIFEKDSKIIQWRKE